MDGDIDGRVHRDRWQAERGGDWGKLGEIVTEIG